MQQELQPQTDSYEQARQALYRAIDDVNALGYGAPIDKSPDTVLVGDAGPFDSFGFVNFVMSVEENVGRAFPGSPFNLHDAISARGENPLTIEALAIYIGNRCQLSAQTGRQGRS